jgi:hypothetical protein
VDQSKELEERADCPVSIMAEYEDVIETKRTKCYTKSPTGGGRVAGAGKRREKDKKKPATGAG